MTSILLKYSVSCSNVSCVYIVYNGFHFYMTVMFFMAETSDPVAVGSPNPNQQFILLSHW